MKRFVKFVVAFTFFLTTPCLIYANIILKNDVIKVVINTTKQKSAGSIEQIYDLSGHNPYPLFLNQDHFFTISIGKWVPEDFSVIEHSDSMVQINSTIIRCEQRTVPFNTTILFQLKDRQIKINYQFESKERLELFEGLTIKTISSNWNKLLIRNHNCIEDSIFLGVTKKIYYRALKQIYEFINSYSKLTIMFPNPYHSLSTLSNYTDNSFQFDWNILNAIEPFLAKDPKGPTLASTLTSGFKIKREVNIFVSNQLDTLINVVGPVAYFSPYPNGYEQVIAMTFDDIPFKRWVYPKSGNDPQTPVQQYLIRLLEDHPNMKMGWIIIPDKIMHEASLGNSNYPVGKWWRAHSVHRISTAAPDSYKVWLRNIDQDNMILGYENRVHLGNHGYHHAPEMEFGLHWEFQYFDRVFNDSIFATVVNEFKLLGLSEKSHKWIRFPGYHFTRATIEALIKYNFVLFDYISYAKLPWMIFYSDFGYIWAIGTGWEGDTPNSFEHMDSLYLKEGNLCHTSGHPQDWFDYGSETAYMEIHNIFQQAEAKYPYLGYMFPDDVGYFANEMYDISNIQQNFTKNEFSYSFFGSATQEETIVVEWPNTLKEPNSILIDNHTIFDFEIRKNKIYIVLPFLNKDYHVLKIKCDFSDIKLTDQYYPGDFILLPNYPNPFQQNTKIIYFISEKYKQRQLEVIIYNILGKKVVTLYEGPALFGRNELNWNGKNELGQTISSGIYILKMNIGNEIKSCHVVFLNSSR